MPVIGKYVIEKFSFDYYEADSLVISTDFSWCSLENDGRIVQESMNTMYVYVGDNFHKFT